MKILITGGCGFLGTNLAASGLAANHQITVFDNLSRLGAAENLAWLRTFGNVTFVYGDIRNRNDVDRCLEAGKFDGIFHLAGQVAMTSSIADPRNDFETNAMGTFHLLDAARRYCPGAGIIYASTNKVYGDLEQYRYIEEPTRYVCPEFADGFPESVPLSFHSPYGVSKGSADQQMLDASRIFKQRTTVFRHSTMYGGRQFATFDQGWIGWFCQCAVERRQTPGLAPFTISGNGKQVRDILHAEDIVNLYYTALAQIDRLDGKAYNIGGGMANSLSLLELFAFLESELDIRMDYRQLPERESDQKIFVADLGAIRRDCGWEPRLDWRTGVRKMLDWVGDLNRKK